MQPAALLLQERDKILILSHASPDGDTLGSACALMHGLIAMGKTVFFQCGDEIDKKFAYLFEGLELSAGEPDTIVSVDVADKNLLGTLRETYENRIDLAIDHHASHVPFAKETLLRPECGANTEIIYGLLVELGVSITPAIADCIYTGLSTDTGCFRFSNVTPETHRIAAAMMEYGARAAEINKVMFDTKSRAQTDAEAKAMLSIEYYHSGRCALISVTREMMLQSGVTDTELDAIVARPRQIAGVLIGVTLKEKTDGHFKASVRTNGPADASAVCKYLGGGGHKGAAGCSIRGPLADAKMKILAACEAHLGELGL